MIPLLQFMFSHIDLFLPREGCNLRTYFYQSYSISTTVTGFKYIMDVELLNLHSIILKEPLIYSN